MTDYEIDWFGDEIFNLTNNIMDEISKEVAELVEADAKLILSKKAKTLTEKGLLSQFYVDKSKFKHGGYLVYCQGPKKWHPPYHASFLEMGTFKDQAKPYLRPAKKKNERVAYRKYQESLL